MLEILDSPSRFSNLENARLLNRIRLIALNGQVGLVLFAEWYLDIRLPLLSIFSLLIIETVFLVLSALRVRKSLSISSTELLIHIIFDSSILAGLVYFSGGANNPFIYLLLLPIALGTFMLTPRNLMLTALLQLLLYSLINIYQRPLELGDSSPLASFHLHLAGMWVNFVLTVILLSVFGLLARHSMLKQEKKIQDFREKQLKDEQILSLGIMSASAAHELGTPLATMAIILDDLKHQNLSAEPDEELTDDIQLLADQVDNCRQIIRSLGDKSHDSSKSSLDQEKSFIHQLESILENWLVYRPQISLKKHWSDDIVSLSYSFSISVEQAIVNLLNNAADASLDNGNDQLEIKGYVLNQQLVIEIIDYGTGISEQIIQNLGADIVQTQKQDGLGWGMFLSNASIERVNGKVQLLNTDNGSITKISLPIKAGL